MTDTNVHPWWPGVTCDHIIGWCPILAGTSSAVKAGKGTVDPEGTDLCGWCLRVWRAQQARAEP